MITPTPTDRLKTIADNNFERNTRFERGNGLLREANNERESNAEVNDERTGITVSRRICNIAMNRGSVRSMMAMNIDECLHCDNNASRSDYRQYEAITASGMDEQDNEEDLTCRREGKEAQD
ncbi:hypothetical protein FQR65_LT19741 [Abscondita terminalis]|nr:hypothetical protein FQR65_LT19741 [Abscondita terminalis]